MEKFLKDNGLRRRVGFLLAANLGKAFVGGPTLESNSLKSSALGSLTNVETKRRD